VTPAPIPSHPTTFASAGTAASSLADLLSRQQILARARRAMQMKTGEDAHLAIVDHVENPVGKAPQNGAPNLAVAL
jgi:hypothetical protein